MKPAFVFIVAFAGLVGIVEAQSVAKQPNELAAKKVASIDPTWESLAARYRPPEWFQDGKIGVWMHWGIPSATDENRPNDGSHYGRRMYGNEGFISPGQKEAAERDAAMNDALMKFHAERYGHFNNDSPYPKLESGKGLGLKLFTDYLNRDLKENDGQQTVVLSFKDANKDKAAFTYNMERGSAGEIQTHPWMWATDLSGGWFYRKDAKNRMSIPVLIGNAVDAISKNGVVMLNVALRGDGTLPENQAEYLRAIGDFAKINGEGIFGSLPWKVYGEGPTQFETRRQGENIKPYQRGDIRFTTNNGKLYAFVLTPPDRDIVIQTLGSCSPLEGEINGISLLGSDEVIQWTRSRAGLKIRLPKSLPDQPVIAFRISHR